MKVIILYPVFVLLFWPFISYAGIPDTTIISLDPIYHLQALTVSSPDEEGCYGKSVKQTLLFMYGDSLLKSMKVDDILPLKTKDPMLCPYLLSDMGSGCIADYPLYQLIFYLANGEPEIHLFYDKGGKLLFSYIANKRNSEYIMYAFDEKQAMKYWESENPTHFKHISW